MKTLDVNNFAGQSRRSQTCCLWTCFCRSWPYLLLTISILGLCLICFVKFMALDWIIDQQIAQKLRLVPGTNTYNQWKSVPLPIIIKFRIFNVSNPVQVQNGAKAILVEAGPYAFEEKRIKEIISMDNEKDTISYRQKIIYKFRPDLSNGSQFDRLVVINVPFVTLSKMTYDNVGNFSFAHALADRNMRQRGERLFTFATVKEYLFDGYSVQHYLNFLRSPALQLIGGVKIPKSIETGKFGFYLGKNGSDDGEYVIRTGKSNPQEFGQIVSWNGKTRLDYYNGLCNLINGTDGSLAPPFITKDSRIRFFSSDICRSIYMVFHKETQVQGVPTYRFRPPNAKKIFEGKDFCFCPKGKNNACYKYGVLSMAPCRDGAPISFSSVHFLDAYEPYLNGVEGLHPDKKIHETFLDIQPKTGLILRAAKRVQFNVMVNTNRDMSTFSQVRPTMFPFMWVEETVEPTEKYLADLHQQLFRPVEMANTAVMGGFISCAILIVVGILGLVSVCISSRRRHLSAASKAESENSDSFQTSSSSSTSSSTNSSRASSQSRNGSIASARTLKSHISSISEASTSQQTIKSLGSITSVISRGTMTSGNETKSTMTEDEEEKVTKGSSRRSRSPKNLNSNMIRSNNGISEILREEEQPGRDDENKTNI